MIKHCFVFLSVLLLSSFAANIVAGQNLNVKRGSEGAAAEGKKFKDRLWYGGGINLGFASSQNESVFTFGITPMVGYKIFSEFSLGPRVGFSYTNFRARSSSKVDNVALFEASEGIFARYKFFNVVFAHAEFNFTQSEYPKYDINEWNKYTINSQNAYVGLGYNAGSGGFGTELYVLYNFLADENIINQPFDIRFGITYKF